MSKLHIMDNDGNTEHFQLLMEQESAGTQRFFARIGGWLQALDNGSLLIVDEIERSRHPLLTTHDALLLDLFFKEGIRFGLLKRMKISARDICRAVLVQSHLSEVRKHGRDETGVQSEQGKAAQKAGDHLHYL